LASSVHLRRGLSGIRDGAGDHGTVGRARAGHTARERGALVADAAISAIAVPTGSENSETRLPG